MKKKVWIGVGLVLAAVGWYAFRPGLLFVNQSVSESLPASSVSAATADSTVAPKALATGQFRGYAHETEGDAGIYEVNGKRVLRLTYFKASNGPGVHGLSSRSARRQG